MARITVNPSVPSAGEFPAWAPGEYELRVIDVQDTVTQNGKAQLTITYRAEGEVLDENGNSIENKTIKDWILVDPVATARGGTVSFLRALVEAAGLAWADFDSEDLRDKVVKARVGKNDRGRTDIMRYLKG